MDHVVAHGKMGLSGAASNTHLFSWKLLILSLSDEEKYQNTGHLIQFHCQLPHPPMLTQLVTAKKQSKDYSLSPQTANAIAKKELKRTSTPDRVVVGLHIEKEISLHTFAPRNSLPYRTARLTIRLSTKPRPTESGAPPSAMAKDNVRM